MIWINLEDKLPTDSDINGWKPWSKEEWQEWKDESERLNKRLQELHEESKIDERNKLIDANSSHWTKLKPWLEKLSYGKCWFFEARNAASHMDVEHFRPKKEAKGSKDKERDGYWWLSFDYMNYRYAGNVPNRKKGGFFPVRKNSKLATYIDQCEDYEECFLLDPIKNYDISLIAFNEEGLAMPAPKIDSWDRMRVKVTIKRLKLNEHPFIVERRRCIWQQMNMEINKFNAAFNKIKKVNDKTYLKNKISEYIKNIKLMMREDAELSSVAKWCFHFNKNDYIERIVS